MKIALLWHMHQPSYWEADSGRYRYPWTFLHAARHYHMMGLLAKENPQVSMTINVTPVLAEQLDDYSKPDFKDKLLDVIRKPADSLTGDDVPILLDHVFKLHVPTMIAPYPRYRELKNILDGTSSKRVRVEEIRDLQVWYLLAWTGFPLRREAALAELYRKGKRFTEEDKRLVFDACHRAVKEVLPLYSELMAKGSVEISTTPYYHPILPLIIDCEAARESRPNVLLGGVSFRFPQDARWHVEEAIRSYEARYGKKPQGMWPAEGSVSNAALELLASSGMKWAATDEAVLARSLGHFPISEEERHRPYAFGDTGLSIFFRDRELSDRIGFVYSSWKPEHAAQDLRGRLLDIRSRLGKKEATACVSIILDGENPWEYYPDSGIGFLTHFYQALASTPGLETVRMGEHAGGDQKHVKLSSVVPGSWVDANFDTWIGCPEKNRAWVFLGTARQKLAVGAPQMQPPREFYRAEGSDWFWWLGPGHDTPYEASYENLFRTNLLEGLSKAGLEAPPDLKVAARIVPTPRFQPPLHLFTPKIEGRFGNYYGWIASGYFRSSEGSFHRAQRLLERVRFGFDEKMFYLRGEGNLKALRDSKEAVSVVLEFLRPKDMKIVYHGGALDIFPRNDSGSGQANGAAADQPAMASGSRAENGTHPPAGPSRGLAAIGSVVEMAIPLDELGSSPGDVLDFAVSIRTGKDSVDRLPQSGFISVSTPPKDFGSENWNV